MNTSDAGCSLWIGIDLASETFQAACAVVGFDLKTWQRLPQSSFSNNPQGHRELARWVNRQARRLQARPAGIVVESTGGLSRNLAEELEGLGLPGVAILNPARIKHFGQSLGQRSKNDKADAAVIAAFGAVHQPPPAAPLSPVQQQLRELDRLRQDLVELQTAWSNSLKDARDGLAQRIIKEQLRLVERQIRSVEEQIDQAIDEDPELCRHRDLLDSVPGIGPRVAATILAELGDLSAYDRDQLAGYVGLFSREHSSGKRNRRGKMVKGGGARVRRVLGMGSMAIMRSKSELKQFSLRLQQRGKSKLCALGALMRKLLLIARAVIISGRPYDPLAAMRTSNR